ncbi:NUDIX domain-containing protein [Microbispora sp. CSR-4]|uniref:NUDIX domain-containing protein n=1 Tax=Microbispora sp. CSR-4 TaxID=2592813 RepID=UPI001C9C644A|nr:NUDIX domain-containing protein [Microbispora sp. CSR-4]
MTSVRHSVRAILFDGDDIVLFRRVRAGREPYWITPGGGVEDTDADPEAALRRELDEELGATAGPALHVFTLVEPGRLSTVFACRLVSLDLSRRSGPEFLEPDIGLHEVRRVRPEEARTLNMVPPELGEYISANAATLPKLLDAATYAPGRYRPVVDVHLLLTDGEKVLLGRRQGTGYADGEWQIMPSGHLEEGESVVDAAVREAREELGIEVDGCEVVHVMHHHNAGGTARIGMFLMPHSITGTPVNAEPHKCAELAWFPFDRLPERTVPYSRAGVEAVRRALAARPPGLPTANNAAHDATIDAAPPPGLPAANNAAHDAAHDATRPPGLPVADNTADNTAIDAVADAAPVVSGSPLFSLHGWDVPRPADLAAEAVRAGFEEITVCLVARLDGAVLVHSDDETDRLPATVVRPGESVEAALARLAPVGEVTFAGSDDYVSHRGRTGRRLAFSALLTEAPEAPNGTAPETANGTVPETPKGMVPEALRGMVPLPAGSLGRLPYAEGVFVRASSGVLYGLSSR